MDTQDGPNINVYLNSLIRAEIISDFTTSRFGRLVVFINDGDTGINFYDLTFDGKLFFGLFRFMHPTHARKTGFTSQP